MIDTITLYKAGRNKEDFEINQNRFNKTLSDKDKTKALFKTFYKDDNDKQRKQPIYIKNDIENNFALIQFSAPKLLYGNSLETTRIEDAEKIGNILEKRLNGIFDADFENMQVSRLDVTQNLQMKNDIPVYIHALNSAYSRNGKYRVEKFSNETLQIKNNSRKFMMYDKVREAIDNKDIARSEAKAYGNVLRYEIQHSKAVNIKTSFKNKKPFTLSDITKEGFFANAKQFQVYSFDMFFSNSGNYELFLEDISMIDVIKDYSSRNILKNFVIKKMTDTTDFEHDFMQYEELLKYAGYSRDGIHKAIKEFQKIVLLAKTKQSDILEEIRNKLVA